MNHKKTSKEDSALFRERVMEVIQSIHERELPPEILLEAYKGIRVENIDQAHMARMSHHGVPYPILDSDMRLCGIYYGNDYQAKGYIRITRLDMADYLIQPEKSASGENIIPAGWVDADEEDELFLRDVCSGLYSDSDDFDPFDV